MIREGSHVCFSPKMCSKNFENRFANKNVMPNVFELGLFWFDFCFTALQHILGHFGRGQLI